MRHALAVLLTVVTATLCAVALLVFPGSASAAGVGGTTLEPGQTMKAGDFLTIPSGAVQLVMQSDGNLVEYVYNGSSRSNERTALWSTQTAHHPGAVFKMQTDGNAVVYLGSKALWNTHTAHNPGARLVLQTTSTSSSTAPTTPRSGQSRVATRTCVSTGSAAVSSAPPKAPWVTPIQAQPTCAPTTPADRTTGKPFRTSS